jgi:hypothetical protein
MLIYNHPEYYPPTLNAIDQLSEISDSIIVIARNNKFPSWEYPANVELHSSGDFVSIRESEAESTGWKIKSFFKFTRLAFRMCRKYKPEWVIAYDSIPLLSTRILKWFFGSSFKLWYHNHDVSEILAVRKYSIGWFANRSEQTFFNRVNLFTLPSRERTNSFELDDFKGSLFIIPNYPSIRRFELADANHDLAPASLKLLFQGFIGGGHGLEEVIDYVSHNEKVSFTIIGPGDREYVNQLKELVVRLNLKGKVFIRDAVPYQLLIDITQLHHLGLAIHKPVNIQYSTAALASNKIYEYAACGLPVLYYDDEHYKEYLSRFSWAFANDLSYEKLKTQCNFIREHYEEISTAAAKDFREALNFERVFSPVKEYLLNGGE